MGTAKTGYGKDAWRTPGPFLIRTALALPVHEVCHAANFRAQTPKNFQTGVVYDSERYSVIYLLSFSRKIQRCCHPKKQKRLRGDPSPRSTAEKGANCVG